MQTLLIEAIVIGLIFVCSITYGPERVNPPKDEIPTVEYTPYIKPPVKRV